MAFRILDVTDADTLKRIPPCADPTFDHRTCDYWEDEIRGSKAHRAAWLKATASPAARARPADNPFAPPPSGPAFNPFDPSAGAARPPAFNPFGDEDDEPLDNPFVPRAELKPAIAADAPRKVQLLGRGLGVFGSYAKVLEADGEPAAYCQFGPLSAYPRARRVRELYARLPSAPLPAVITCIATTTEARGQGHAHALVEAVVEDLASRGFSAVEAYPEPDVRPDATSAANPAFWSACGFDLAIDDPRFPV